MTDADPISEIRRKEPRYPRAAYEFVQESLRLAHEQVGREGHVSGRELLDAFRSLALAEFGPLAGTVLGEWNVRTTDDVGRIVFLCVEAHQMGKTDDDTMDDFHDVYEFAKAFPATLGEVKLPRKPRDPLDDDDA